MAITTTVMYIGYHLCVNSKSVHNIGIIFLTNKFFCMLHLKNELLQ